jgi:hypothetical protein
MKVARSSDTSMTSVAGHEDTSSLLIRNIKEVRKVNGFGACSSLMEHVGSSETS